MLSSIQQETEVPDSPTQTVNSFNALAELNPWTQSLIGVIQLGTEEPNEFYVVRDGYLTEVAGRGHPRNFAARAGNGGAAEAVGQFWTSRYLAMEGKRFFCSYLGVEVELTPEREGHIMATHPGTLPDYWEQFAETLSDPDQVRESDRDDVV